MAEAGIERLILAGQAGGARIAATNGGAKACDPKDDAYGSTLDYELLSPVKRFLARLLRLSPA